MNLGIALLLWACHRDEQVDSVPVPKCGVTEEWVSEEADWTSIAPGGCGTREGLGVACAEWAVPPGLAEGGETVRVEGRAVVVGEVPGEADGVVSYCLTGGTGEVSCSYYEYGEEWFSFEASGPYLRGASGGPSRQQARLCFLSPSGGIDCWGGIGYGDSWTPGMPDYPEPVHFDGPYVDMAAWGYPARALDANGTVVVLGEDGEATLEYETDWISLVGPNQTVCGIRTSGEIGCRGCEAAYGLCEPHEASGLASASEGIPDGVFTSLSFDGGLACALTADGEPVCWSTTYWPDFFDDRCHATPPSGGRFASLTTASSTYVCGIRTDGHAACWGSAVSPLGL